MRIPERESGERQEPVSKPTLTELHAHWLKQTREAWLLREERLRDTVLVRTLEDEEKIKSLKPFHGVAHFNEEGILYLSRWVALAAIDDPERYTVLWPKMMEKKMAEYLARLPQSRPFLVRTQLAKVSGVERAIRMTDHIREDYLPQEGERTLETREMVVQIRRLLTAYARSKELTPAAIRDLNYETINLIKNSGFVASRLPMVQAAVGRVLEASKMRDQTGRFNPTACRQMLYSALKDLTSELELKHPQIQAKYAALEAVLEVYRGQMRWALEQTNDGLVHFLKSAPYRQPSLLAIRSTKDLAAMKRGMVAHLHGLCLELGSQIKLQPYKPVAQAVVLGLRGGEEGEEEAYRAAGWRGDPATALIVHGSFGQAERRIRFCLKRINDVLREYESVEKEKD